MLIVDYELILESKEKIEGAIESIITRDDIALAEAIDDLFYVKGILERAMSSFEDHMDEMNEYYGGDDV